MLNENDIEQLTLQRLQSFGWEYRYGNLILFDLILEIFRFCTSIFANENIRGITLRH